MGAKGGRTGEGAAKHCLILPKHGWICQISLDGIVKLKVVGKLLNLGCLVFLDFSSRVKPRWQIQPCPKVQRDSAGSTLSMCRQCPPAGGLRRLRRRVALLRVRRLRRICARSQSRVHGVLGHWRQLERTTTGWRTTTLQGSTSDTWTSTGLHVVQSGGLTERLACTQLHSGT